MKTLYLKDGAEIKRDGVDARDYVRAGLATYEKPEIVQEAIAEHPEVEEDKPKRGRKPKGE